MTDWTTARVTPETLAELRRLLDGGPLRPWTAGTVDGVDYGAVWGAVTKRNGIYVTPMIVDDVSLWPGTAELIAAAVNALPALLDAAAERDRLAEAVERVRALATEWATQPTDYDEDTEIGRSVVYQRAASKANPKGHEEYVIDPAPWVNPQSQVSSDVLGRCPRWYIGVYPMPYPTSGIPKVPPAPSVKK